MHLALRTGRRRGVRAAAPSLLLLLLLVGLVGTAFARQLPGVRPERIGVSGARLERITDLLGSYVERELVPGAAAIVLRDGRVIYERAVGRRGPGPEAAALDTDAIFRLASMTKPLASVALMMLWEEGRFLLDDPVARYEPAFADARVLVDFDEETGAVLTEPAERPVTVRDLLTHTSGIGYGFIQPAAGRLYGPAGIADTSEVGNVLADRIERLAAQPLLHQPGARFTYGLNTDVVGHLVEVLSGETLADFLEARLFAPLGMDSTGLVLSRAELERLVAFTMPGFALDRDDEPLVDMTPARAREAGPDTDEGRLLAIIEPSAGNVTDFSGGSGAAGTLRDYARFAQMVLDGGVLDRRRLLGAKTVQLMGSDHIEGLPVFGDAGTGFGLGFSVVRPGGARRTAFSEGTLAWGGAWGTAFHIDPVEGLVLVLLTNTYPNRHIRLREEFVNVVYQALVEIRGR